MSLALALWRLATRLLAPVLPFHLRRRARRGKEISARLTERFGAGAARPPGPLLWLHAASVGETLSILPLLPPLLAARPSLHLLVTTGTVTSARLLAERLPEALADRVQHRFAPLDVPAWVARFLDDWRPDAGAFVESELWPNLLAAAAARGIPLALLNARISARSAARWARAAGFARETLGRFRLILAQSEADAARFRALGGQGVSAPGNLKFAAPPLPAAPEALAALQDRLAGCPVIVAASTHPGEEPMIAAAHAALLPRHPRLVTILVPRHPERGAAIATTLGLPGRRGEGGEPAPGTLYLADTLGELGLFFRLADVALIGGSLVPHGGQNPLEPARLGCPVLAGPHMGNFAEIVAALEESGGLLRVAASSAALAEGLAAMLSHAGKRRAMAEAAAPVATRQAELPGRVAAALLPLLSKG